MTIFITVIITAVATLLLLFLGSQFRAPEKSIKHDLDHLYPPTDEQFLRSMGTLLPPAITQGNRIEPLHNGDEIFPAMLQAISAAQRTVCFETFIYWQGDIGKRFADAFIERAKAGVPVHVLLDWLGSKRVDPALLDRLERGGVDVQRYHPLHWYNLDRVNHRTHRKLLIVDGKIGFTGGVGIADEWLGDARNADEWRDTHFRVDGPAVAQMQSAFMDNWLKTHSRVLHSEAYFPALESAGDTPAQLFRSSANEGSDSVRLMYLLSITAATESVLISTAYFVPDDLSIETLIAASRRGVRVEIIVPGEHIDTKVVRRASRARWGKLLRNNVAIYEFQPTMFHTKTMIIDGVWVSVGSTNFDNRSFRLNDEANLNAFDRDLARRLTEDFEKDRGRSKQITLQDWMNRPLRERAIEHLAAVIRWQL